MYEKYSKLGFAFIAAVFWASVSSAITAEWVSSGTADTAEDGSQYTITARVTAGTGEIEVFQILKGSIVVADQSYSGLTTDTIVYTTTAVGVGESQYEIVASDSGDPANYIDPEEIEYVYHTVDYIQGSVAPAISAWSTNPAIVHRGDSYTVTVSASDADGDLTSLVMTDDGGGSQTQNWPGGVSNGSLSRTLQANGNVGDVITFTATATDSEGTQSNDIDNIVSKTFQVVIADEDRPSATLRNTGGGSFPHGEVRNVLIGEPYAFELHADDGTDENLEKASVLWSAYRLDFQGVEHLVHEYTETFSVDSVNGAPVVEPINRIGGQPDKWTYRYWPFSTDKSGKSSFGGGPFQLGFNQTNTYPKTISIDTSLPNQRIEVNDTINITSALSDRDGNLTLATMTKLGPGDGVPVPLGDPTTGSASVPSGTSSYVGTWAFTPTQTGTYVFEVYGTDPYPEPGQSIDVKQVTVEVVPVGFLDDDGPPSAPGTPQLVVKGSEIIEIQWSPAPETDILTQTVYWNPQAGGAGGTASVSRETASWQIGGLTPDTLYDIYVTANDKHFHSTASGVLSERTNLPPLEADIDADIVTLYSPGSARVYWTTANADSVTITSSPPGFTSSALNGDQTVTGLGPGTHTFTLSAEGPTTVITGPVIRTTSVTILGSTTASIWATPSQIISSESTTLNWTTEYADTISITGPGLSGLPSPIPASGSHVVSGLDTGVHTFTITATGGSGTVVDTEEVTVDAPSAFSAAVLNSYAPGSARLIWDGDDATSVTISSSPAGFTSSALTGNTVVENLGVGVHTFTMTAERPSGTEILTDSVTILEASDTSLTASASVITLGQTVNLSWNSSPDDSATLVGPNLGGLPNPLPATGSFTVNGLPFGEHLFTLTATSAAATLTDSVMVTVINADGSSGNGPGLAPNAADILGTLGGDLSVDNRGLANYTIPLMVPAGRSGLQPSPSVHYSSGSGNGIMGVGFSLSTGQSSITRGRSIYARDQDRLGVEFTDADKLYLDGKRLLRISGNHLKNGSEYRTEVESFSRITGHGVHPESGDALYFKVETKEGDIRYYGNYQSATDGDAYQQLGGESTGRAYAYALARIESPTGHYITYHYRKTATWSGEYVLETIKYTGHNSGDAPAAELRLYYNQSHITGDVEGNFLRDDARYGYMAGRAQPMTQRLDVVTAVMDGVETHRYDFTYEYAPGTRLTRLKTIDGLAKDSSDGSWKQISPTTFTWQDGSASFGAPGSGGVGPNITPETDDPQKLSRYSMGEFNGDGIMDWVLIDWTGKQSQTLQYEIRAGFSDSSLAASFENKTITVPEVGLLPNNYNGLDGILFVKTGDIDGDGLTDLVYSNGDEYWALRSNGERFEGLDGQSNPTRLFSNADFATRGARSIDPDIINPALGLFEPENNPRRTLSSHVDLGDFNGDGRADFLLHNSDLYIAYSNGTGFDNFAKWADVNDDYHLNYYYTLDVHAEVFGWWKRNVDSDLRGPAGWYTDFNGDGIQDYAYTLPERPDANIIPNGGMFYDLSNTTGNFVHKLQRNLYVLISDPAPDPADRKFHLRTIPEVVSGNQYKNLESPMYQGESVASLTLLPLQGDFNGDGLTDLMCLAPRYVDEPEWHSGKRAAGYVWRLLLSKGTTQEPHHAIPQGSWDYEVIEMAAERHGFDVWVETATGQTVRTFAESMREDTFNAEFLTNLLNPGASQVVIEGNTDTSGAGAVSAVDINQDGLTDMIWRFDGGGAQSGWWVALCRNQAGQVFFDPAYKAFDLGEGGLNGHHNVHLSDFDGDGIQDLSFGPRHQITYEEQLHARGHYIAKRSGAKPDLLIKVTNGLGRQTEISYSPLSEANIYVKGQGAAYPIRDVQDTRMVVSDVYHDYGADFAGGEKQRFSYTYAGSRMDFAGRGDLGFQSFITLDHQTDLFKYQFLAQSFPMTGMTVREETYQAEAGGKFDILSSHDNTVVFDAVEDGGTPLGSLWPYVSRAKEYRWEDGALSLTPDPVSGLFGVQDRDNAHVVITATSKFDGQSTVVDSFPPGLGFFPGDTDSSQLTNINVVTGKEDVSFVSLLPGDISLGNLTELHTDYGDGHTETVAYTYKSAPTAPTANRMLTGRVASVTTTAVSPHATTSPVAVKSFDYDGDTSLVRVEYLDKDSTGLTLTTTHDRDGYGRIKSTTVAGGGTYPEQSVALYTSYTATAWDDRYDLPTATANAYGHATTNTYHDWLGLPTSVTDTNGIEQKTDYDALGRVKLSRRISATTDIQTDYAYAADTTLFTSSVGAASYDRRAAYAVTMTPEYAPAVTTYHDRLGRAIRTQRDAAAGSVYANTIYNDEGQVIAVSNPGTNASPAHWTTTTYDDLGRVDVITAPNGTNSSHSYDGLSTTVTVSGSNVSHNQVTKTTVNARGETVSIWNPGDSTAEAASVAFTLDGFGRMVTTSLKGQTETISATYDRFGNQATLTDPDKGAWSYRNSPRGEVVRQEDANSTVTLSTFDDLGRPKDRTTTQLDGSVESALWIYFEQGSPATTNSVALPASGGGWRGAIQCEKVTHSGGPYAYDDYTSAKSYTYDTDGRPSLELYHVDNKWFYTTTDYHPNYGLPTERYYYWRPRGGEDVFDITNTAAWRSFGFITAYDASSYVTSVSTSDGATWWSNPTYDHLDRPRVFTNGGLTTTRTYRATDELLTGISTPGVQSLGFDYDGLGNLTSRTGTGGSEMLTYDVKNRLESSSKHGSYTYSLHGNIESKTLVDGTVVNDYAYGERNHGPHAVTTANGVEYTYDLNGNLVSTNDGATASWTGFDKPRWLAEAGAGSGFHYNLNRQRVVQHTFTSLPDGATPAFTEKKLYIGSGMEADYSMGASELELDRVRLYVTTPSGRSGAVEVDADYTASAAHKRLVYHQDHLGSIDVITEFVDQSVALDWASRPSRYSYDPWGERRDPIDWSGAPTTTTLGGGDDLSPRGFTDHEMLDDLSLIHMNGRIYDPLLGRFLSADTIIDGVTNLQGFNRYSYVKNNPLTYTDPTGYSAMGRHIVHSTGNIRGVRAAAFGTDKADKIGRIEGSVNTALAKTKAEIAVPYVGDAMDVADLVNPESSTTTQVIAGASLAAGAGPLPNIIGPIARGFRNLFRKADAAADVAKTAGKQDAPDVSRVETKDIEPDGNSSSADTVAPTKKGGRKGSQETRQQNQQIGEQNEAAGRGDHTGGGDLAETYFPNPEGGRKGGRFADVTNTEADGTRHITQTVDTKVNGEPTEREIDAALDIYERLDEGETLELIPKNR